jgi:RNA polymerase sigma-70 factor (ECF subfamily)
MVMICKRLTAAEERRLVELSRSGDAEAFGELVRSYQDRLFNSVLQILQSRTDAEDTVQDAFVQAYLNLDSFQGKSSFYTWLYRIAVNLAFSCGRKRRTEVSVERTRDTVGTEPLDKRGSPSSRMERAEQASQLERALASLSEEHRVVLILRGVEGLDYEKIAEVLQLNPGTVRSRIHRARTTLRERLNEDSLCMV